VTDAVGSVNTTEREVWIMDDAHDTPIRVDHVGIAVRSVADAEPLLLALGCERLSDEAVTAEGSVPYDEAGGDAQFRWTYYRLGDASRIELIEPIAAGTFLAQFIDEHGPGLHHVTLEVADLDAVAAAVEAAGFDVVDRQAFDTWEEAFVSPRNAAGTLFQLMEYGDGYADGRKPPEELFVNGAPVAEVGR
jgi:methylmalonyl-CoA/ethylmalonyl-CoA epimerase